MNDPCHIDFEPSVGRCCCNCVNHRVVKAHPWNKGFAEGSIKNTIGYACACPDMMDESEKSIIFFDNKHGKCEMHEYRGE